MVRVGRGGVGRRVVIEGGGGGVSSVVAQSQRGGGVRDAVGGVVEAGSRQGEPQPVDEGHLGHGLAQLGGRPRFFFRSGLRT